MANPDKGKGEERLAAEPVVFWFNVGKFEAMAAANALPLEKAMPVKVGANVIAGVVVAVATVPDNPFAVTTLTLVTVPEPDPEEEIVMVFPDGVRVMFVPAARTTAPVRVLRLVTPPPPPPVPCGGHVKLAT